MTDAVLCRVELRRVLAVDASPSLSADVVVGPAVDCMGDVNKATGRTFKLSRVIFTDILS